MRILAGTTLAAFFAQSLLALDFGADYPRTPPQPNGKGFYAGLAEQFTYFNDTQPDIINPLTGQRSNPYLSTITSEPYLGYNFCKRFGLQLELPVIYRQYQAVSPGNAIVPVYRRTVSDWGMGDVRLLGNFAVIQKNTTDCQVNWNLTAGVKFPTGDSSALSGVGPTNSAVSSPQIALGSGSYDGVVGTDILLRKRRLFFSAETQYAIRNEADFSVPGGFPFTYQYANDLSWYGGPGVFLAMRDNYTLSLQAIISGDTKGHDTIGVFDDRREISVRSTSETGVYAGPQINFTWHDQVTAQLGADLPVTIHTSGTQIVPTFRLQAAVTVRF